MRKLFYLLWTLLFFTCTDVYATNKINSVNMDVYISSDGTAHVTETWMVDADQDTELYKAYYNLGSSEFLNFKVSMDGKQYTYLSSWYINASFNTKAYKNGFNYVDDGIELCFGISEYGTHNYTFSYDITNFVDGLTDADAVYWNLWPENFGLQVDSVYIKIYADYSFPNDLDVWGYGYKDGYAYVYDGYIEMSTKGEISNDEYIVALIKFPKGTFNTSNTKVNKSFDTYLKKAESGAQHYNDLNKGLELILQIVLFIINFLSMIFPFWMMFKVNKITTEKRLGNSGTLKLKFDKKGKNIPKNVPLHRDIPCNRDVFRAYWIAYNYGLTKKNTDFLGAVLLKWLKEGYITVGKGASRYSQKETTTVTLNYNLESSNFYEKELYSMLDEASRDGVLEEYELHKWSSTNYTRLFGWFNNVLDHQTKQIHLEGHAEQLDARTYKISSIILDEAKKMAGLKKFLIEFSRIKTREAIEVSLWEEYLIYAQIFGIADKVSKQFKRLYPEIMTDFEYSNIEFIRNVSIKSVRIGASAKTAAEYRSSSYSSGGGGRSSRGGGGSSRGRSSSRRNGGGSR